MEIPDLDECERCGESRDGHAYLFVFGEWDASPVGRSSVKSE